MVSDTLSTQLTFNVHKPIVIINKSIGENDFFFFFHNKMGTHSPSETLIQLGTAQGEDGLNFLDA